MITLSYLNLETTSNLIENIVCCLVVLVYWSGENSFDFYFKTSKRWSGGSLDLSMLFVSSLFNMSTI